MAAGYDQPVERVAAELVTCLDSPALALGQWEDEMAVVRARLPPVSVVCVCVCLCVCTCVCVCVSVSVSRTFRMVTPRTSSAVTCA